MQVITGSGDVCSISFSDKVQVLSDEFLKCCLYITKYNDTRHDFNKKLYSELIGSSQVLEDFLDFHGAKNCEAWYFYRELTAAVRHLSLGAYSQKHIANRLMFYDLPDAEKFASTGDGALDFLNRSLTSLAPVILEEARRLDISIPKETYDPGHFPGIVTSEKLPYDIDDEAKSVQRKHIVNIASQFLDIADKFEQLGFYKPYTIEEIFRIVPEKVNEVEMRRFEMLVHNLQSTFDTYVIHGGFRFGDRKLKRLRSFFSVSFHLLQMIGRLLHFFERHLHETSYKNTYKRVQEELGALISPEILIDYIINYGLFYVCHYLMTGKDLAREILTENVDRSSIRVGIPVKLGFHSRPSLLVAKIVQHYGGPVELHVGPDSFDAGSVLDIQWAGGKINKEKITEVIFEGDVRALNDIEILAGINYGEDSMGKGIPLPKELGYLK
jgi:phosphotransferase system HPr-like phosphotransfer protein